MTKIRLLVELRVGQSERVHDIDHLLGGIVDTLITAAILGGGICADVDVLTADGDFSAVRFVDYVVD